MRVGAGRLITSLTNRKRGSHEYVEMTTKSFVWKTYLPVRLFVAASFGVALSLSATACSTSSHDPGVNGARTNSVDEGEAGHPLPRSVSSQAPRNAGPAGSQ